MKIHYGTKTVEWDRRTTVKRILERLEIVPETVIVAKNGELVTEEDVPGRRTVTGAGVPRSIWPPGWWAKTRLPKRSPILSAPPARIQRTLPSRRASSRRWPGVQAVRWPERKRSCSCAPCRSAG